MADPNHKKAEALRTRVLQGPGHVAPAVRQAAAANVDVPLAFASYVDTIHKKPAAVTDDDVEALKASGFTEYEIFEVTVAAATGAGFRRLDAVLALLEDEG